MIDLKFDPVALKARYLVRHGTDVGSFVFDAEMNRRRIQDERHAELVTELTANHKQTSELSHAAGQRREKSQARITAAYSAYLAMLEVEAKIDSEEQAAIAPLRVRSSELQRLMRSIAQPRLSERELQDVAIYNSMNAELQRKSLPTQSV
jgi:hypothetical protein